MICFLLALSTAGCGFGLNQPAALDDSAATKTFSVQSYGAKGNGIADDAPAIQSALNAAVKAGGGQVVFPCGEFSLQSVAGAAPGSRSLLYVKATANIQMTGQGHCSHLFTVLPQKSVLEFEDSTSISIISLHLTALNAAYVETYGMDGGSAVRFTGVSGGVINQVEVDGSSAGSLYLTKGTSHVSVTANNIHDTYGSGTWEDDCGSASATSCSPSLPPSNNTYTSNTFTNVSLGTGGAISVDDGNGVSNALIQNNTVSWTRQPIAGNPGVHCIGINNASNVTVLDNSCSGTPWDAIVITTGSGGKSSGVVIRGNVMTNSGTSTNGGSGVVVYDAPLGLGINGFTIASNTITTASDDGIRLIAASKPGNVQQGNVEGNTIQLVDQRSPGSHFGIDIESSLAISTTSNIISCTPACTAAGVRVVSSPMTLPTAASNQVSNILGPALVIQ